ncbi:MAG: hypothetical protein BWX66_00724 [Deltaproteobacteria bacterium ADurb.Bin058]|nr:MAG: hypothetical protein BWX66_00724 [Deltaproteobacteria bacterium ADurb.Bin058]
MPSRVLLAGAVFTAKFTRNLVWLVLTVGIVPIHSASSNFWIFHKRGVVVVTVVGRRRSTRIWIARCNVRTLGGAVTTLLTRVTLGVSVILATSTISTGGSVSSERSAYTLGSRSLAGLNGKCVIATCPAVVHRTGAWVLVNLQANGVSITNVGRRLCAGIWVTRVNSCTASNGNCQAVIIASTFDTYDLQNNTYGVC